MVRWGACSGARGDQAGLSAPTVPQLICATASWSSSCGGGGGEQLWALMAPAKVDSAAVVGRSSATAEEGAPPGVTGRAAD